ncbi:substrate-binding periplasmic protein [Paludibacterium yongneupense]|uniref:substrate-binding periplasmic protein n=1 Tax=Paludibacterium yongneupense TaxID=400061 RepID=UPI0003F4F97A|nr:ABC transporter substrate-binding protein [Paludibacterium yongneupense]
MNFTTVKDVSYASAEDVRGFSVDIVREIMARTKDRGVIKIIPWPRSYKLLSTEPNVVLFSMARTPLRELQFQWVGPLSFSKSLLYVRRDSKRAINTLDDARKLNGIAVMADDSKTQFLESQHFTNLNVSTSWGVLYHKVQAGRMDALADTNLDFPIKARAEGFNPVELKPVFELFETDLYIGFSKSTPPDIVHNWQVALDSIKRDGTFFRLAKKWSRYWNVHWVVKDGALQPE